MKLGEIFRLQIFDRYILKKYISTFIFTLSILSLIAVVFDISERIQKFISKNVAAKEIIQDYYFNFLPWINSLLFPLYSLITVIFFTSRLAEKTEIIPVFSSGMSYKRFLKPFVIASIIFTLLHLFLNHYWVPKGNKTMGAFENKYIKTSSLIRKDRNAHFIVQPGVEVYISAYNSFDSSGTGFHLSHTENSQLKSILRANQFKYDSLSQKWKLKDYEIRSWSEDKEAFELYSGKSLDTNLNLKVSDFIQFKNNKNMMQTGELSEFIEREIGKGSGITREYIVEKHRRTADPVTTLILSIIGVCIASRKVRGGLGLHLASGVIIGVIFIFLSKLSLTFANSEMINPIIAIWSPNIIFSFLAFRLYKSAQQ
ncbi:MAG: YjgP/YjgQ family permease [Saprospiraceae bacterium]|nr:YjgP/YjgQ family permease [Saprospiraceae bacterium]